MQAFTLNGLGDYDKLEYQTRPLPKVYNKDVLIRVGASAVNNTDINTRIGWYAKTKNNATSWNNQALKFPRIQGADVCGEIVAVGKDVSNSRIGQRVLVDPCLYEYGDKKLDLAYYLGSECDGGFAEFVSVGAKNAHAISSNLKDEELASFPCSYSTAQNLLTRTGVKSSDTVLITGASGGVGSASVQLAKARGAKVVAITTAQKSDELMRIGADKIVLRGENISEILGQNSVDVVIDLVGGKEHPSLIDALKPRGRYGVSGAVGGAMVELDLRELYLKDLSFFGCTTLDEGVFSSLVKHIENGDIKPLVAKTFALKDLILAQKTFLEKKHIGKITLKV